MTETTVLLAMLFLLAAMLYSSAGMPEHPAIQQRWLWFGVAPSVMKPTALVLNLLVATIALIRFQRAGYFSWPLLWPFALGSIPAAFIGGAVSLPGHQYKALVGFVLLLGAVQPLIGKSAHSVESRSKQPPIWLAVFCGGIIGLLAGLTGTGGGIFLSPLVLFAGWAETRDTGGVSAAFILVNSAAGLTGNLASMQLLPSALPIRLCAAVLGGIVGTELGTRRVATETFRKLLGIVLFIAGGKLVFGVQLLEPSQR